MNPAIETRLRSQLTDRRRRLQEVLTVSVQQKELIDLLQEVDLALEKMGKGTYGLCETCHDSIEEERILADPLCRNCLDHLTLAERKALESDLDLAFTVQRGLLPKTDLEIDGWRIAHHYDAAGPVSGDYCDLIVPSAEPGSVYFLVGDVSGKGVAASILMAHLHAIFRSLMPLKLPVNQLVEHANRLFSEGTLSTHYATLVCGKASASGQIEICNAGHCPPLVLRGTAVKKIESTGLPVGLFSHSHFDVTKIVVERGDSLLLYTDGLTESTNEGIEEYGEERLSNFIADKGSLSPRELVNACLEDLGRFRASVPRVDDLTILALQCHQR
jgi:sigma-B regulation protein RsbU (phosphoserine phosphatase)